MNSAKFEVVDTSVALTGQPQAKDAPANLDFEK
jgi:hypothetical protein